jgi:hypothetical protein
VNKLNNSDLLSKKLDELELHIISILDAKRSGEVVSGTDASIVSPVDSWDPFQTAIANREASESSVRQPDSEDFISRIKRMFGF